MLRAALLPVGWSLPVASWLPAVLSLAMPAVASALSPVRAQVSALVRAQRQEEVSSSEPV